MRHFSTSFVSVTFTAYNMALSNSLILRLVNDVNRLKTKVQKLKNGNESRARRPQKFFWTMVCLVCCVFHSYKMTTTYLEYEMSTEALYYPTDPIVPPAITFCVRNPFPKAGNCQTKIKEMRETCNKFLNNSKAFFENIYKFSDIVNHIVVVGPNGTFIAVEADRMREFEQYVRVYKLRKLACYHVPYLTYANHSGFLNAVMKNMAVAVVATLKITDQFADRVGDIDVLLSNDNVLPFRYGRTQLQMQTGLVTMVTYVKR